MKPSLTNQMNVDDVLLVVSFTIFIKYIITLCVLPPYEAYLYWEQTLWIASFGVSYFAVDIKFSIARIREFDRDLASRKTRPTR